MLSFKNVFIPAIKSNIDVCTCHMYIYVYVCLVYLCVGVYMHIYIYKIYMCVYVCYVNPHGDAIGG